jgi:hypothetical protein
MYKAPVKILLTAFFVLKILFITDLCRKKPDVNGKFYKEVIKRFIAGDFRKVGPGVFCTTMHRRICQALSSSFERYEGSLRYLFHPTLLS